MNYHALLDDATIRLSAALVGSKKFFAQSLESPPIDEATTRTTLETALPDLDRHDTEVGPMMHPIDIQTPTGTYETAFRIRHWRGESAPTIIFHHGSGEDPFATGRFTSHSVKRLFPAGFDPHANLIVLRAPFHGESTSTYAKAMGELGDFVGMLAASTALAEALTDELHDMGSTAVVLSGISLGGWVTTLHRAFHGSADMYAPIFAGHKLGEMFVASVYHHMTGELARENPDRLREILDFDDAYNEAEAPCKPVLALYDRIIQYGVQRPAFKDADLSTIKYGHVTGSLQSSLLREHVLDAVTEAPAYEA
jgi:hypothetical protein